MSSSATTDPQQGSLLRAAWRKALLGRPPRTPAAERLVVMTREPVPGTTKTRLAPLLGMEGAARLAAEMLRTTLETARAAGRRRGVDVEVRVAGPAPHATTRRLAQGLRVRPQGPGDLGARMRRTLGDAVHEGSRRVVIVGTDCPALGPAQVEAAFDALATAPVVIGPAPDGGYHLVGARAAHRALFEGVPWGTDQVLAATRRGARRAGLDIHLLPALSDVDEPADLATWSPAMRPEAPWLSVVVPTLDEEAELAATLATVRREPGVDLVVADGASRDATPSIARHFGATVVTASASRGGQLRAGIRAARGEALLLLHADTRLPPGYGDTVRRVLGDRRVAAGAFELAIDDPAGGYRLIEAGVRWRSRVLRRPYGDQAIFLRRSMLDRAGGMLDRPRMEDYVLLDRLRRLGRIVIAPGRVRTSARRWRRRGILRTTWAHQVEIVRHHLRARRA